MNPWVFHIFAAIPHPVESRILLIPEAERWTLPRFTLNRIYSELHLLQRAIRTQYGTEMTVLRWLWEHPNHETRLVRSLWLMDNHMPDWQPPAASRWVDRAALDTITLADEALRPALERAFDTLTETVPAQRPDWFRRGWFQQAQAWMREQLTQHGYTLVSVPEQFKQFNISSLLRAETNAGEFYMKAAVDLPLFGDEPKLMQALGALFPQQIPAPLAIDSERRWMLSPDFGAMLRGSDPSLDVLQRAMQEYARLQISTADLHATLFAVGCHDRRLPVLAAQIDGLLADDTCFTELNDEERAAWKASGPALRALCDKLAGFNIPHTLVHGDFHAGNVALRGDDLLYFDWTDACVAHPFFDPPVFIEFDAADHAVTLRDAYLDCWTAYEPVERLQEAWEIALLLGYLHQAVSYQGIRAGMEPAEQSAWDWAVPHFARLILKGLENVSGLVA